MKELVWIKKKMRTVFYNLRYDFINPAAFNELNFAKLEKAIISKIDSKLCDTNVISPLLVILKKRCSDIKDHCPYRQLIRAAVPQFS